MIAQHFPQLLDESEKYVSFFAEVVERTARLVAQWQAVGWAHGVLNTDNMSILGITLDYGPYGFMDDYDPGFICNHSDYNGRYAFNQQPYIGLWNLSCLAQTLLPLAPKEALKAAMDGYQTSVDRHYRDLMRAKLGLVDQQAGDEELLQDLKSLLVGSRVDYTIFWRELGTFSSATDAKNERLREHFLNPDRFDAWAGQYRERLQSEQSMMKIAVGEWTASIPSTFFVITSPKGPSRRLSRKTIQRSTASCSCCRIPIWNRPAWKRTPPRRRTGVSI